MKRVVITLFAAFMLVGCCNSQKPQLRHVVLFGFEEGVSPEQIKEVEIAFAALQSKITEVKDFEWGTDCSPEGLQQGHTHCFFATFESEEDRDNYLVHPAHQEFGKLINGKIKNATVIDYFIK